MVEVIINFIRSGFLQLDSDILSALIALRLDFLNATTDWTDFIQSVIGILKPISLIVVSLCFLLEFISMTIKFDILKWEFLLKVFFKLVFARVCIDVSFDLLTAIYQTACEWVLGIGNTMPLIGRETWNKISDTVQDMGFWQSLGLMITSGIMFIGVKIGALVIRIMAYARMVELSIYMALSPLPCAFLPLEEGGGSRIPKHYFLTFASVCLSGVIMVMSVWLYTIVAQNSMNVSANDPVSAIGEILIATVVLIICMSKSSSIAKSIFDV